MNIKFKFYLHYLNSFKKTDKIERERDQSQRKRDYVLKLTGTGKQLLEKNLRITVLPF